MSTPSSPTSNVRIGLPKGRMQDGVLSLLSEAGIRVSGADRSYRPSVSLHGFEVKMLKPQTIVDMLHHGSRDVGFAGADWVAEKGATLVELLDTGLDPVRLVAAAPVELLVDGKLPRRALIVASEYEQLARRWIERNTVQATFVRSYGATEVFPPEDADVIVDNTSSGDTLRANGLQIFDELMTSSTRLYAHPRTMDTPGHRASIEHLVLLVRSVLEARRRVMLEVNVPREQLESVIAVLPCMRGPTVSELHAGAGYAVKAAVPRELLPRLIPEIKARGGTDIVVTRLAQIVP